MTRSGVASFPRHARERCEPPMSTSGKVNRQTSSANVRPNTLGLNQRELQALIDLMERPKGDGKPPVRRDFARWPFRKTSVHLDLHHPGGSHVTVTVACRNLSRGGIGILHAGYVHPGTVCVVHLPRTTGPVSILPGVVVRCAHRGGMVHELGIRFDQRIDLAEYVATSEGSGLMSIERVAPEKLAGRVLTIEPGEIERRIVQHFLRETGLRQTYVSNIEEAMAEAQGGYDVILLSTRADGPDAGQFVERLRDELVETPVIVLASEADAARRLAGLRPLGVGVLPKPMTQEQLLRTLAEAIAATGVDTDQEREALQQCMNHPLAGRFVADLSTLVEDLKRALRACDGDAVTRVAQRIQSTAPSIGFTHLAGVAARAVQAVAAGAVATIHERTLRELLATCKRILAVSGA